MKGVAPFSVHFFIVLLWQSSMYTNKPFDSNLICYEKYKVLILLTKQLWVRQRNNSPPPVPMLLP
jgi:hypothetical protein